MLAPKYRYNIYRNAIRSHVCVLASVIVCVSSTRVYPAEVLWQLTLKDWWFNCYLLTTYIVALTGLSSQWYGDNRTPMVRNFTSSLELVASMATRNAWRASLYICLFISRGFLIDLFKPKMYPLSALYE